MATVLLNFNGETLLSLPPDFTSRWNSPNDGTSGYTRVEEAPAGLDSLFGAQVFVVGRATAGNYSWTGLEYTALAGSTQDELTGVINLEPVSGGDPRVNVILRGSGTDAAQTGYVLRIGRPTDQVLLTKRSGVTGTANGTTLATADFNTISLLNSFRFRFRARTVGSDVVLNAWLWNLGEAEPTTPTLTFTDTSPLAVGWMGVGYSGTGLTSRGMFGFLGLANNGDAAPGISNANYGIRITGLKTPNDPDTLVTGITTARIRVWLYGEAGDAPTYPPFENQTITHGVLELALPVAHATETPTIAGDWGTSFFRVATPIVDLDA